VEVDSKNLLDSTEDEKYFRKNAGSIVTDGKDEYVVILEDNRLGLSIVLPNQDNVSAYDYKVLPSSYLYKYSDGKTRRVLLPGSGVDEYLTIVWIEDRKRKKLLMRRGFFLDKNDYPVWFSVFGSYMLSYDIKNSKWVFNVKSKKYYNKEPKNKFKSWCGIYDKYTISPRIQNPLLVEYNIITKKMKLFKENEEKMLKDVSIDKSNSLFTRYLDDVSLFDKLLTLSSTGILNDYLEMLYIQKMLLYSQYPVKLYRNIYKKGVYLDEGSGILKNIQKQYSNYGIGSIVIPQETYLVSKSYFKTQLIHKNPEIRNSVKSPILVHYNQNNILERKKFLSSPTNPVFGKMNQFVTFYANEDQLFKSSILPWYYSGPPSYKKEKISRLSKLPSIAKYLHEKINQPQYKDLTQKDVITSLQYAYHRLRTSIFVSIRKGSFVVFSPIVKADYTNYFPRTEEFWYGDVKKDEYLVSKNKYLKAIGKAKEKYSPISRWFVNNSLIGNIISPEITSDHSISVVLEMLRQTIINKEINDCDFLINVRDFPKLRLDGKDPDHAIHGLPVTKSVDMPGFNVSKCLPVLGFNCHPMYADIPIPVPDDWKNTYGGYYGKDERGSNIPNIPHPLPISKDSWKSRKVCAVFRGGATGFSSTPDMNQRLQLLLMKDKFGDMLDVELVSYALRDRKTDDTGMKHMITPGIEGVTANTSVYINPGKKLGLRTGLKRIGNTYKEPDTYTEQDACQMVFYVDGNAAAYRYSSLMAGGFVILRVESLVGYEMWFYPELKNAYKDGEFNEEGDHILINKDYSNLEEVLLWVKNNQESARKIAENCVRRYKTLFNKKNLLDTIQYTLNKISEVQKWKVDIPEHKMNIRLISEPPEARSYRIALRNLEKRGIEREKIISDIKKIEEEVNDTSVISGFKVKPSDLPEERYERETANPDIDELKDVDKPKEEIVYHTKKLDIKERKSKKKYYHSGLKKTIRKFI
jgi:hypothetical protein